MKYWRGYLTAFIFAVITWALIQFGQQFTSLVDMVYPYVIRTMQNMLAQWSGSVDFVVWQMLVMALVVIGLATAVLMIVLKWNPIQWFGWVLAAASCVYMIYTLVFGLNYFAGPLAEDIRLEIGAYNVQELTEAAEYYRDRAIELSTQVNRDASGNVDFADFDTLASQTGDGFHKMTYDYSYPVFAGETTMPVKKLAWSDWFSSRGITGITVGITGESCVNPDIPDILLPFSMSHEMAHRMCIYTEEDANFAAFLTGSVNESVEYQYSAYFMAYRYCYMALVNANTTEASNAAARVNSRVTDELYQDMSHYNKFFSTSGGSGAAAATNLTPDENGFVSYGKVADLLVSWHIQQIVLPSIVVEEDPFDPYDSTQVDLSGIVNAKTPTAPTEGGE
ncbi:MAG: DUF3810 domain-containing protein [Ruminococcaceae bacterium]|nr:DUF3810 domain-containing protein [Oscillospiraceae bacterium]